MAEIETPRGPQPPPPRGGGEEASAGSFAVSAMGACGGICLLLFGVVFSVYLLFPFAMFAILGFFGVLMVIFGVYLLYWTCRYAQKHNRVV